MKFLLWKTCRFIYHYIIKPILFLPLFINFGALSAVLARMFTEEFLPVYCLKPFTALANLPEGYLVGGLIGTYFIIPFIWGLVETYKYVEQESPLIHPLWRAYPGSRTPAFEFDLWPHISPGVHTLQRAQRIPGQRYVPDFPQRPLLFSQPLGMRQNLRPAQEILPKELQDYIETLERQHPSFLQQYDDKKIEVKIGDDRCCPIMKEIMNIPVLLRDRAYHFYNLTRLETRFDGGRRNPMDPTHWFMLNELKPAYDILEKIKSGLSVIPKLNI